MSTETTGAPSPRPWTWSEDKTRWTSETDGGVPLSIERLEDGDEDGNGASFLPRAGEAVGPICDGVLAAAQWIAEYLGGAR